MKAFLKIFFLGFLFFSLSCSQKTEVEMILYNGKIQTLDSLHPSVEAIAIHEGKIEAVGTIQEIERRYVSPNEIDLEGRFVYPGFMDPHSHFYGYAKNLLEINLRGAKSIQECLGIIHDYLKKYPDVKWLTGRGWDHTLWGSEMPSKEKLDSAFPDIPVYLKRVDGHAAWVNSKSLEMAGIDSSSRVEGGEILLSGGECYGILVDNAATLVSDLIPDFPKKYIIETLLEAQKNCFEVGLCNVTDAGLEKDIFLLLDSLSTSGDLKIRIYAMADPGPKEFEYLESQGKIDHPGFSLRSVKVYCDGALGSRGACLREDYSDRPGWKGYFITSVDSLKIIADRVHRLGLQLNTHAIGDSANHHMIQLYQEILKDDKDPRWRIEHAQVVSPEDIKFFDKNRILPSVQPTHATSDMRWAETRLGSSRVAHGYAYKEILNAAGLIALGSDFPVEKIPPLHGFFAAVERKDHEGWPNQGFQMENKLSRMEALKGMTIWAAYAQFEEDQKGSVSVGKYADLVVLEKNLLEAPMIEILEPIVFATMVNGQWLFQKEDF
jgi:predicted amidohydrolase YtcJ